jgi:sugar phosphate isomerase/epimerase
VPWLRVFDGGVPGDLEALAETLRWWQGLRRAGGWRCDLIIETHDTLFAGSEIAALARLVPGTRILWDSFNTWLKGGEDPLRTWAEIREHVVHLHVKDAVRRPSEKFSWTYVLPGEGEFPFRALLRQMEADGYAGHASLEWELLWHPYLAPLPAALESAKQAGWR